jgi:hypothetical protein
MLPADASLLPQQVKQLLLLLLLLLSHAAAAWRCNLALLHTLQALLYRQHARLQHANPAQAQQQQPR